MRGSDASIVTHCGDCIDEMDDMPAESVDAVVTDPPYGLAFMSKSWDDFKPREFQDFCERWGEEALHVLKPGAFLLAFCGTRTYHRMVCGLEDAGFVIRDAVAWMYGSGFPKSHDISKAIDKKKGAEREVVGDNPNDRPNAPPQAVYQEDRRAPPITIPATDAAKRWQGWGTALKPAFEMVVVAQKPREGTFTENVLKHGCGGLNIDGCRIPISDSDSHDKGRFPANVVHDGSSEVMACMDAAGESKSTGGDGSKFSSSIFGLEGEGCITDGGKGYGDNGSPARFFYSAKAAKNERNAGLDDLDKQEYMRVNAPRDCEEDKHNNAANDIATLKPINLMRWLVRLVTPPNGVVLDPFAGSGTTGCAAAVEGVDAVLIEKRERFAETITPRRVAYWSNPEHWSDLKEHGLLPDGDNLATRRTTKTLTEFGVGE